MNSSLFMNYSIAYMSHDVNNFNITKRHYPDPEQLTLLLRKGVFPYDYIDDSCRFFETCLQPKDAFYSTLMKEDITDGDYEHARKVWSTFKMLNLGDYHDLYVKTDVLLSADVFENFRDKFMDCYKLDPAHYLTSHGLVWDTALKLSNAMLELLIDPDMHLFF